MKPIVEKLPLGKNASFLAEIFTTPEFEVPWHQHMEFELILFLEGEGTAFVGNYVGEFKTGDVFFLGANLPHTFQKLQKDMITSALVIQFREDFWGSAFMELPECRPLRELFAQSMHGLKLGRGLSLEVASTIGEIGSLPGIDKMLSLLQSLRLLAQSGDFELVSTLDAASFNLKNNDRIDRIFQFTIDSFQEPISLTLVAAQAGMSVPAFCHYFRKRTKKTYIDFLNEVRIGYACQLLIDTQKQVADICYESGYNTLANFNKQFLKVKKLTPTGYRKNFSARRLVM